MYIAMILITLLNTALIESNVVVLLSIQYVTVHLRVLAALQSQMTISVSWRKTLAFSTQVPTTISSWCWESIAQAALFLLALEEDQL